MLPCSDKTTRQQETSQPSLATYKRPRTSLIKTCRRIVSCYLLLFVRLQVSSTGEYRAPDAPFCFGARRQAVYVCIQPASAPKCAPEAGWPTNPPPANRCGAALLGSGHPALLPIRTCPTCHSYPVRTLFRGTTSTTSPALLDDSLSSRSSEVCEGSSSGLSSGSG